jgi:hypothetical protein
MHVNFFPSESAVAPAFEHFAPAFTPAALSGIANKPISSTKTIRGIERLFTMQK